ncbi:hypothetical protein BH10ACI2_BH10ACI2_22150 [soil metagenome]
MLPKLVLALGIIGVLLGMAVTIFSFALVPLTNGRTSIGEAMLGIIPGIVIFFISLIIAVVGLIFVVKGRKKA